jgi:SAM-dependent methyltransferase
VCDLGCGPGHVAGYLHDRGVDIFGIDLSPGMIEQARKLNPAIEFQRGNMLALDAEDGAWAAIVAFYAIVHIPKTDILQAFREMFRALKPGGFLFLAFHIGLEVLREENLWGHQVSLDVVFYARKEVERYLGLAGFAIEDSLERDPYAPEVEYQSRRAYIRARKPVP